ncbi:hypothetical protein PQE66_gp242 [Bacillus phage PBC2]|uniref:Uncharacterized protein n=1 Tax=Bacillus phage PBC2 TaxID=1675029 RepID=A0A218KCD5_9CAUD|nr:hypothetical protein PQE66_gp242 [Bacillus phage PBC2]AKQ08554.1 hypothetical protein PBC2_239 [Bacillus phage PBC2]
MKTTTIESVGNFFLAIEKASLGSLSLEDVREIVVVMKKRNMSHIYPSKISNMSLRNENISEIIIDEEDTVFMMVNDQPVMLPQFAMVV